MIDENTISQLKVAFEEDVKSVNTAQGVDALRSKYLGRSAELNNILRQIKDLSPELKQTIGKQSNELRQKIEKRLDQLAQDYWQKSYRQELLKQNFDITAIPEKDTQGALHPITRERLRIEEIFTSMGFTVHEPNLIDDEYHNFTSLNIPANHPAKDMWDTVWVEGNNYLITHTSSMQNRIISSNEPPIRAIVPGRCFRNEATDRTHEHSFFQIEGVYVDKGIKLTDLIGTISHFLNTYYGMEVPIKIQPTYFPFVEPGLEIMVQADVFAEINGIKDSKLKGKWIELVPCGMIHPNVIKEAGLDPAIYSGFAWGMGLDRLIMMKYSIDDIRIIHSGMLDFTRQFN